MRARRTDTRHASDLDGSRSFCSALPLLDQAREILQSLQNEEQISLNERARDQEWAAQSTQILGLVPKLERSVVEMEKEKRGYLLTGDNNFAEAYKRALANFYTVITAFSPSWSQIPEQAARLGDIQAKVENWINSSALPGNGGQARRARTARRPGRDDNGEALMAEFAEMIADFERSEPSVYETRTAAAKQERIIKTSGAGDVCSILAVSLLVVSNSYSFVLGPAAADQTRRRRNPHQLDHRKHSRWHDHGRRKRRDLLDESGRGKNVRLREQRTGRPQFHQACPEILRQRTGRAAGPLRLGQIWPAHRQHHPRRRPHAQACHFPDRNFAERNDGRSSKSFTSPWSAT